MKAYWWRCKNFGDELTPIVLEWLSGEPVEFAAAGDGRIVGIGSIAHHAQSGDIVFGAGSNRPGKRINGRGIRWLAVRGPFTRSQVRGVEVPEVYGDPALLLPLVYMPPVIPPKKYSVGIIPHYVDKPLVNNNAGRHIAAAKEWLLIDIQADPFAVIDQILQCERIVSTSLHGIIAAEAYGIPAEWAVWGSKVIGGEYKFRDYLLGTGRPEQGPGPLPPIPDLAGLQRGLIEAFKKI